MSTYTTTSLAARIAPMRLLRQLVFRLRARGDNGLETEIIDRQVTRELAAVSEAKTEAETIEARLARVRAGLATALENDGVIDTAEARPLARQLLDATTAAHRHAENLEALT